MIIDWIE